jgi:hypothetical protein
MLISKFPQRSGIEQSMISAIISSIIGHLIQQDLPSPMGGEEVYGLLFATWAIEPSSCACTTSTTRYWDPGSTACYTKYSTGSRFYE